MHEVRKDEGKMSLWKMAFYVAAFICGVEALCMLAGYLPNRAIIFCALIVTTIVFLEEAEGED